MVFHPVFVILSCIRSGLISWPWHRRGTHHLEQHPPTHRLYPPFQTCLPFVAAFVVLRYPRQTRYLSPHGGNNTLSPVATHRDRGTTPQGHFMFWIDWTAAAICWCLGELLASQNGPGSTHIYVRSVRLHPHYVISCSLLALQFYHNLLLVIADWKYHPLFKWSSNMLAFIFFSGYLYPPSNICRSTARPNSHTPTFTLHHRHGLRVTRTDWL